MKPLRWFLSAAMAAAALSPLPALAQDATQVAAGGIVSLQSAPLTIAREHLTISPAHVVADYTFRNDAPQAITTTMAFLVPSYSLDFQPHIVRRLGFIDTEFLLDGQPVGFDAEVRAQLHGQDVTSVLQEFGIDIASFGHYDDGSPELRKLSPKQVDRLVSLGLYSRGSKIDVAPQPEWTVYKRYVRDMNFAPGLPVRLQVSYTPVPGSVDSILYQSTGPEDTTPPGSIDPAADPDLRRVCAGAAIRQRLEQWMALPNHNAALTYVDFFLTGNLAWKIPVQDFTLEVDTPAPPAGNQTIPSFCWPDTLQRASPTRLVAHAVNFTPAHDLRIGWFDLEAQAF